MAVTTSMTKQYMFFLRLFPRNWASDTSENWKPMNGEPCIPSIHHFTLPLRTSRVRSLQTFYSHYCQPMTLERRIKASVECTDTVKDVCQMLVRKSDLKTFKSSRTKGTHFQSRTIAQSRRTLSRSIRQLRKASRQKSHTFKGPYRIPKRY